VDLIGALKSQLRDQGVPMTADVRGPLQPAARHAAR
jgi:hypothetical protein